jgi:hypothetical protein
MAAVLSSGSVIITTSASRAASAGASTRRPAASALAQDGESLRSPTTTETPEAWRFWEWAWPWLP